MFTARNTVTWETPTVSAELESYFGNPEAIEAFAKHGLRFTDGSELRRFLSKGILTSLPEDVLDKADNFASSTEDLEKKLSDQTYSQAYKEIENKLEKGALLLQAPIIIQFKDGSYWGFSGRKRAYAARKNGISVQYYLVKQEDLEKENAKNDQKEKKRQDREDKVEQEVQPNEIF